MKTNGKTAAIFLVGVMVIAFASCQKTQVTESAVYDYEMKSFYDTRFDCIWIEGRPTFAELVAFQSSEKLDLDLFINSAMGEKTAQNFYTYITYAQDPMNKDLVAYWAEKGLDKIQFGGEDESDPSDRYYLYVPANIQAGETFPVIIVNHGGGEPAYQAETFGFCEIAAEERIILIMAEDTSSANLYAIYQDVKAAYPVDETRVYATGSSMGAMASKSLAANYPNLLAAIAPLDICPGFSEGTDVQRAAVQENGLPMIFMVGTADKYGIEMIGFTEFINFNTVEEWNALLKLQGYEEYAITAEESADMAANSANAIERLTGRRVQSTQTINYENTRIHVGAFENEEGINDFTFVVTENRGHLPAGYDAEIAWDFLKNFARDVETGELIYLR